MTAGQYSLAEYLAFQVIGTNHDLEGKDLLPPEDGGRDTLGS